MDFRSLKIRDTNHMHQHTHIGKKKSNNNNNNNNKMAPRPGNTALMSSGG